MSETILTNARIILEDDIIHGTIRFDHERIIDIDES